MASPSASEATPDPVLAIVGPTAAGKTALALALAERLDGEIIAMDSRTVYRGLDIGTAKPDAEARRRVPHHGLDLLDPGQRYSAGRFARDARRWIREIRGRGRLPILAGGTGFFLRALTEPLFREPAMDRGRRDALASALATRDDAELRRWLGVLDGPTAVRLQDSGGRQRLLRALEVALLTGRPLSWWQEQQPARAPALEARTFVVSPPRDMLYDRINRRVEAMVEMGLVEEVRGLLDSGCRPDTPGMNATGYPEIAAYLDGERSLDEAVDTIQRATRRFARRQLTWFRNQLHGDAVWLDGSRSTEALADEVEAQWRRTGR